MTKDIITVCKTLNSSEYLSEIDINEADAEFVCAISENDNRIYSILFQNKIVGIAQMIYGRRAFLYIYISPKYRRRGYGRAAASLLEQQLHTSQLNRIMTCYRSDDPIAYAFSKNCGYTKEFASDYMVYSGPLLEVETVPVRKYRNEDYPETHSLYAEAFHVMRLGTGCFPNSIPEAPNEVMQKYWSDTDNERLLYLMEDEIVGYAHIEGAEIGSVSVKCTHQGKGIGKKFLKCIINKLLAKGHEKVSLYCVVGNDCARHLYDGFGFTEVYRNDYAIKET